MVVRTAGDPSAIASLVRDAVWSVDPDLSIARVQSMEAVRSVSMAPHSFNLRLLGIMALVALVLSAEGLYGVTAYSVARRTREIGLRIALGAERRHVIGLALAEGARLTLWGVIAGGIGAVWLTRLMKSLLVGIAPTDPVAFGAVIVLFSVISLTACYVPARRAARIDPMTALRCE